MSNAHLKDLHNNRRTSKTKTYVARAVSVRCAVEANRKAYNYSKCIQKKCQVSMGTVHQFLSLERVFKIYIILRDTFSEWTDVRKGFHLGTYKGQVHTRVMYHGGGINQACRIDVTSRLCSLHNKSSVRRARNAIARRKAQGRKARHKREA